MKIPEAFVCDAEGCAKDADYRITHEILGPAHIMMPNRRPIVFEFCLEHAGLFFVGGGGNWQMAVGSKLKQGAPEGI